MTTLIRQLVLVLALLAAMPLGARAGDEPSKAYALIIAGEGDDANFSENYRDWSARLNALLTSHCGIPSDQVAVLIEKKELLPAIAADTSTKEHVAAAFAATTAKIHPGDQLLVFLIGHGTQLDKTAKLCLPGADLTSVDVAGFLGRIPTAEVVVVGGMCASDGLLESCSLPGRVLITATNQAAEGNEAYFMEFFLRACESFAGGAGQAGGKRPIGLLDVFNLAASECPKWYLRQYLLTTKPVSWRIDGKRSRLLWQKFYGKIPDKVMAPPENPDQEDEEPVLGEWGPQWKNRRIPTEHAQLDDNGDHIGAAVFAGNVFTPLTGTVEGEDGWVASRTVLGQPRGDKRPPAAPIPVEPTP
ncbi:MAG: hypothetical protein H0W83_01940 [Planctomycetes bacterium]|nr:hypothetical protein [Planctomycetota bacterium]